jgi:flagellar biogenesis protein FliO
LAVNVLFGLAIIPLAIWVSRKFGDRMGSYRVIQRLMRVLAGYDLNAATGFLATLSEFADEKTRSGAFA